MRTIRGRIISALTVLVMAANGAIAQTASSTASNLNIVVIAGEDAINIIQQKTAVAPVVEVRDRNGLPVAGAVVTFSIQGGNAAFPGALSTFAAVTNSAGQVAAVAVQPISAGSFSIQINAVFQGQTAVASIVQSNVMTAAQAAAAGGSASAGGTTGAAGGGGVSATTVGVVGAAVAGGALAATQISGSAEPVTTSTPSTIMRTLTSPISFTNVHTISSPGAPFCTIDHGINGTVTIELTMTGEIASGTLRYTGTDAQVAATCQLTQFGSFGWGGNGPVTGTRTALNARIANTMTTSPTGLPAGATNVVRTLALFEGAFDGTAVTGAFTYEWNSDISGSFTQTTRSRTEIPVTLR